LSEFTTLKYEFSGIKKSVLPVSPDYDPESGSSKDSKADGRRFNFTKKSEKKSAKKSAFIFVFKLSD
jgi:hypothetical protein